MLYNVDIETATTRERYDTYLEKKAAWTKALRPARNADDREAMWRTAPRMVHGDDPRRDKIVTIQFRRLSDLKPGEVAPLTVLREWEHPQGEKGILAEFAKRTGYYSNKWACVMVGFNLDFEKSWLWSKGIRYGHITAKLGMADPHEFERPCIDLQHWAYLANANAKRPPEAMGETPNMFYGASLSNYSRKRGSGSYVTELYHQRRHAAIEDYVQQEADSFLELWNTLIETVPKHWLSEVAPRVGRGPAIPVG
jgi:hypothetical protein